MRHPALVLALLFLGLGVLALPRLGLHLYGGVLAGLLGGAMLWCLGIWWLSG